MTSPLAVRNLDDLQRRLQQVPSDSGRTRPFVTISYAQCLDGSIATKNRRPLTISGRASLMLTHHLRSLFDGILVGINTVLADNPQLTVRRVAGRNPQPVVLDTHLRTPVDSRLIQRDDRRAWLASSSCNSDGRAAALVRAGAVNLPCRLNGRGEIDLHALMALIYEKGIRSLMVEGGARVITSFLQAELVDQFVITISPAFVGGLQVVDAGSAAPIGKLTLGDIHYERLDDDLIVWARPEGSPP